jgi:hypothetical protein
MTTNRRSGQQNDPSFLLSSSPEWVSPLTSNTQNEPAWGSNLQEGRVFNYEDNEDGIHELVQHFSFQH